MHKISRDFVDSRLTAIQPTVLAGSQRRRTAMRRVLKCRALRIRVARHHAKGRPDHDARSPALTARSDKRILVLYYSQSGDVRRTAEALTAASALACDVRWEELRPKTPYPSPWRSVRRFFDVMPECVLGIPPEIEPLTFDPDEQFDLVVLAYQVWFLSPSLPILALLHSPWATVFRDTPTVTLSVSRNMWQAASRIVKRRLSEVGACHLDNVVVMHQGAPLVTFLTTTRALLWGKRGRILGLLPPAGISQAELDRVGRLGELAAGRLPRLDVSPPQSLLAGDNPVEVHARYVVPELVARRFFCAWARCIHAAGRFSRLLRGATVLLFAGSLVLMIVLVLPVGLLAHFLFSPWGRPWLQRTIAELKQPGGE